MSVSCNLNGIVTGYRLNEVPKKDKQGNTIAGQTVIYRDILLSPADGNGDPLKISIDGRDSNLASRMIERVKGMLYKNVLIVGKFRMFDGKIQGVECVDIQLSKA